MSTWKEATTCRLISALLLILVGAACGSDEARDVADQGRSAATTVADKATGGRAGDVCSLVTVAELKAAIGATQVPEGTSKKVGASRSCSYDISGNESFQVQVLDQVDSTASQKGFAELETTIFQGGAQVPGVGKKALYKMGGTSSNFAALLEKSILVLFHSSAAPGSKEQLTDVAKKAISRMG